MSKAMETTASTKMILCCDLQPNILASLTDKGDQLVASTNSFLARARNCSDLHVGFVRVAFREGYPEVHPNNTLFSAIKKAGVLVEGTEGAALHPKLDVQNDPIFTKRRVGAFSTTELATFVRVHGVEELTVFGVSTGAVVNATVQAACDLDIKVTVIEDLCDDRIKSRHDALMAHVFPNQGTVCSSDEWLQKHGV